MQSKTFGVVAAAAIGATLACSVLCYGQDADAPAKTYRLDYSAKVLIEGGKSFPPNLLATLSQEINARSIASGDGDQRAVVRLINLVDLTTDEGSPEGAPRIGVLNIDFLSHGPKRETQSRELWEMTRKQLEAALRKVQQRVWDRQAEDAQNKRQVLELRKDENQAKLKQAVAFLEEMDRTISGTPEQLAEAVNQLRQLKLNRIGITARREAIEKRIDQLRAEAEASANHDPVLEELEKVVKIRVQQLEIVEMYYKNGIKGGSEAEVQSAKAAEAEARIALLQAKRAMAADSSGSALAALNDELAKLYVDDAEMEAREHALLEIVAELQKQLGFSSRIRIEQAGNDLKRYRAVVEQTEQALLDLENQEVRDREIRLRPLEDILPKEDVEKK